MSIKRLLLTSLALACCIPASAHEFWLQSSNYSPQASAGADITAYVGEFFVGDLVGITTAHAASIRVLSSGGAQDLGKRIPATGMLQGLRLSFAAPGTHVVLYDSHPSLLILSADKFHAYLHDEGLDAIIAQREAASTAAAPGRERFRRNAKALLRVEGRSDPTSLAVAGQRLEIVPLTDPLAAAAGELLRFELRFEGKPLAGALVKAWHKRTAQTTVIRARSDAQGRVGFELPFAGTWMLNTVHMIPVKDVPEVDWDSFWSSLTFELGAAKGRAR